jgi:DEAD/DEAH box helicase domain-containing protein
VEAASGRTIGTVDGIRVLRECHPGAIYLHAGRQYLVRELDLAQATVLVEPAAVDWYTNALGAKDTRILEVLDERHERTGGERGARPVALSAWLARLRVTETVIGYERKKVFGSQVLSQHALTLPPVVYESVGVVWAATPALEATLRGAGRHLLGSLHAAEHAAIALLPLLALCDRGDIGGISTPYHPQVGCGAVFVYEGHAGGVGIAERGFAALPEWLRRVARLLAECPCDDGCPSCVQSPKCGNGNRPLDKAGALLALRCLLGQEAMREAVAEPWRLRLAEGNEEAEEATAESPRAARASAEREAEVAADDERHPAPWREAGHDVALALRAAEVPTALARPTTVRPSSSRGAQRRSHLADRPSRSTRARRDPRVASRAHEPWLPLDRATVPSTPAPLAPPPAQRGLFPLAASLRDLVRSWWRRGRGDGPLPAGGTLLFDLETLRSAAEVGGWGNAHRMGVALAVVCHLEEQRFRVFREREVADLAATLRRGRLVVGYNVRRFDYRVLSGYTGADYAHLLPTLDLLEEVHRALGFRLRMNDLALATLGSGKSADGLQSLAWVKQGRLDLVEQYCRKDVEVLRDLYLFGRREGYLLWRDRQERDLRLPVRW